MIRFLFMEGKAASMAIVKNSFNEFLHPFLRTHLQLLENGYHVG